MRYAQANRLPLGLGMPHKPWQTLREQIIAAAVIMMRLALHVRRWAARKKLPKLCGETPGELNLATTSRNNCRDRQQQFSPHALKPVAHA
jgi:hypothetical protein